MNVLDSSGYEEWVGGRFGDRLADQAFRCIEEQIVTLQLPPGSVWSEVTLSERLGIGRTPIREAVQRLVADRIVVIRRRHGIMISEINIQEQLLVLEVRQQLERLLASRAARRALPDERVTLARLGEAMETSGVDGDVIRFLRKYFDVKEYVCRCARNAYAARAIAPLYTFSRRFYFLHHRKLNDLATVARLHADLARAVTAGDEQAAADASDRIAEYAIAFTKRILTEQF
jgi:DNA-binding GntR family transcriptional regulator